MSNINEPSKKETPMDSCAQSTKPAASAAEGALPREVQGKIGKELRHIYGRMLAEPLPSKFGKLLDELGDADGGK